MNARVTRKVALDIGARLLLRNPQLRGQSEGRDAVDYAKIHGLGAVARLLVHLGGRHAKDFTGSQGV